MSTIDVNYDGRAFVPQEPLDIPAGTQMKIIILRSPQAKHPLASLPKLAESAAVDPDYPHDLAKELDHYLYGMPKQDAP